MCGRFVQQYAPEIPVRFDAVVAPAVQAALTPRYNVAPTQQVPVVIAAAGERQVDLVQWGLTPRHGAKQNFTIFNARAETLLERASFRRLLPSQRCLIPANGFYEWEQVGGTKLPWLYQLQSGETFALAGLYDRWTDEQGREVGACTVITTEPNELVLPVHNRMPVILAREIEAEWLNPHLTDPYRLLPLLAPYPAGEMRRTAVSRAVNNSRVDRPELLQPVAA